MPRSRRVRAVRSIKKGIRGISVLGSGKVREKEFVYKQAVKLGEALAGEVLSVFHGGFGGVMEAVAKGSRRAGGHNVGVTILGSSSKVNPFVDVEIKMPCWQSRLSKLIEKGDAYVFLDGATGTLNELFFVWEMANRKLHTKPIILLGKRLHQLVRFLKKDPSLKIPANFHLVSSVPQAIKLLKG